MNHIPSDLITSSHPVIGIYSFIAFYTNEVETSCQITVKIVGSNNYFRIFSKTACSIFYDSEYFGKHFFQNHFHLVCDFFLDFIYFCPDRFAFFQFFTINAFTQRIDFGTFVSYIVLNTLFDCIDTTTQFII